MSVIRGSFNSIPKRHAFTILETVMSTVLVSILMVVSLSTYAQVSVSTNRTNYRLQATEFARYYINEALSLPFVDPDDPTVTTLGIDTGETATSRSTWDDFDDFNGISSASLTDLNGTSLPNSTGWLVTTNVHFCNPSNPIMTTGSPTDMKLMFVNVRDPAGTNRTFVAFRSNYGALQHPYDDPVMSRAKVHLQDGQGRSWTSTVRINNLQSMP